MSNQRLMVLEGNFHGSKIVVSKIIEHDLPEGSLINGVIINEADILESLKRLWEERRLSRGKLQIVIDSTQFQLKNALLPKLRDKAMISLVKNEFSGNERYNDPIFDYMILRENPANPKMQDILCSGVERSFIHSYVELFRQAKLQVRSIDTALGGILKLIGFLPLFRQKTCLLLIFNGENLLSILLENGFYKYSSRTRLLSQVNTTDFAVSIQRAVSSIQQFQAVDNNGYTISEAYFCGCKEEVVDFCRPGLQTLGLNPKLLPEDPSIEFNAKITGKRLSDIVYLVGDFMRR
jgi:Tfp pilus assembly PilM family ATPase